ncbi:MAG TPA: glutathionylspermidine synthase family protein [Gammaproteobacteria bacterium]|nr:glutathionylspermidine synthase family protein [Gammaproteobacteria bacterium]
MLRIQCDERPHWRDQAHEYGFKFHTMHGEPYWDETAYYQFTLEQIERDIEDPTAEIHQMCLAIVDQVVRDEALLRKFQIPELYWDVIANSWFDFEPSLYSRIDFSYHGKGPAKLYENNADTPTSLYETGFWQWLWLEDKAQSGQIARHADQFNSLQEKLIDRFSVMAKQHPGETLHFSACKDTDEDRGTVQYLEDCAVQAGIRCKFVYIEDIGHGEGDCFTDIDDQVIHWMFKLYPWEFMFREEYGPLLLKADVSFIEPYWKAILSNKALLALLWQKFPNHPNLLATYFEEDMNQAELTNYVKKPIFSREGANISIIENGNEIYFADGPYGEEGYIYQAYHPLPKYGDNYTLVGSWLVDGQPAGISMREDKHLITQDLSRYLPHIIL